MTKYTFELEFNSANEKPIIIKIPHANMDVHDTVVAQAMKDIIDTNIIIYSIYQPESIKSASLIKTTIHEYDLN